MDRTNRASESLAAGWPDEDDDPRPRFDDPDPLWDPEDDEESLPEHGDFWPELGDREE